MKNRSRDRFIVRVIDLLRFSDLLRSINRHIRKLSYLSHKFQYLSEWNLVTPEYFDHQLDLNYVWQKKRFSYPIERGVFSSFALSNEPPYSKVLDLCCGDGFYSYYFYSKRARSITAIDFDANAIKHAKKHYKADNIEFKLADIRDYIPNGPFDNIIWDAAIEHFTEIEIEKLMNRIKTVLSPNGILSGYTIAANETDKQLHHHEYEFHDKSDLARFFKPYFRNIQILSTTYPDRSNLYFYASDSDLPFERSNTLLVKN